MGFISVATGDVNAYFCVTLRSRICIHYHRKQTRLLERALGMEGDEITSLSAFVKHRHVQHGGCGWRAIQCDPYHTFLTPEIQDLLDAIALANEDGSHVLSRADELSVKKISHSREAKGGVDHAESKSSEDTHEKNLELLKLSLEGRSIPKEE